MESVELYDFREKIEEKVSQMDVNDKMKASIFALCEKCFTEGYTAKEKRLQQIKEREEFEVYV